MPETLPIPLAAILAAAEDAKRAHDRLCDIAETLLPESSPVKTAENPVCVPVEPGRPPRRREGRPVSDTLRNLRAGRDASWGSLVPAFDWAIHEAIEAEYRASVASDAALAHIAPTYPTIVGLLAEAGRATAERGSRITDAARADQ